MLESPFHFEEDARRERGTLRWFVGWLVFVLCLVAAGVAVALYA